MNKVIIGIDPGRKSGAVTVMPLDKHPCSSEIKVYNFSDWWADKECGTTKTGKVKYLKKRIDKTSERLIEIFRMYNPYRVFLEEVFRVQNLVEHRAEIVGVLKTLLISYESVNWEQWKTEMNVPFGRLPDGAKRTEEQKRRDEYEIASGLYPLIDELNKKNSASLLIAEYGRRKLV